jgi:hypothetical protein
MADQTAAAVTTEESSPAKTRSDRRVAALLFVFFAALYLLTSSGHLYSPDGEFAFRMARSISIDPKHEYLAKNMRMLSQWGIMVPVLSQPFVLLGEPLANAMPQKDGATVNGRYYTLGIYGPDGPPQEPPTVGADAADQPVYVRSDLPGIPTTSLVVISYLALSKDVPQDTAVAEVTLTDKSGASVTLPLRAGVETAEWSRGRAAPPIQHGMAPVASVWSGNTAGRNYYAEIPLGRTMEPTELRIRYLAGVGGLYVRSLALLDKETGAFQPIPSDFGMWSARENNEYFALIFYGAYNAIVTALCCLLLFAAVRLLGYSQVVSAVAALVYGLATMAWPYSKLDFTEPTLTLLALAPLYLILRWGQNRRNALLLAAGLCALMAAVTKYVAAVLIPVLLLQIVLTYWESYPSAKKLRGMLKPLLMFLAPFLVVAAPAVYYMSQRYGYYPSIFEAWAGIQRGWLPLPFLIGLRGLLFSPGRSFFLYSPPAILALVSVVAFVRRHRMQSVGILGIILVYFAMYSKKVAWDAGAGWGPRYQVVILPLVVLVAAPLIQKAIEERHRWARYALVVTFVLGIGIQFLAVSKDFDYYLGMFRYQIVTQMPDKGAQYGGGDYFPYSEGLSDANATTATVWAWQFSPILAHAWLLSADALDLARPVLRPLEYKLLGTPPWRMMGVDIVPEQPANGLGLDFWSTRLWTDFPSNTGMLVGIALVLLALETAIVFTGARLVSLLSGHLALQSRAAQAWIIGATLTLLMFDGIHFLL